jgi:hypothetical protein
VGAEPRALEPQRVEAVHPANLVFRDGAARNGPVGCGVYVPASAWNSQWWSFPVQTDSGAVMPPWEMPAPMKSTLDFYDTFLPLRVSNSLTRTVTPFVPMLGKRVLW